jgi:hypothetical protein
MTKCHYSIGRCRRRPSYVGDPSDPTNARGTVTALLEHLELASKTEKTLTTTSLVDATRQPSATIFTSPVSKRNKSFRVTVPATQGSWKNTCWPHNVKLRWFHDSGLSSCDPSFFRPPFFSSFSSLNSSFTAIGNRTAKLFPFTFVTCRNVIFFLSKTIFLLPVLFFRPCGKRRLPSDVKYARTHRTLYPKNICNFPGR